MVNIINMVNVVSVVKCPPRLLARSQGATEQEEAPRSLLGKVVK